MDLLSPAQRDCLLRLDKSTTIAYQVLHHWRRRLKQLRDAGGADRREELVATKTMLRTLELTVRLLTVRAKVLGLGAFSEESLK